MQLNASLEAAGHLPDSVATEAHVHIRQVDGTPTITQIDLVTTAKVPGLDDETFQRVARRDPRGSASSRARSRGVENITVDATLES